MSDEKTEQEKVMHEVLKAVAEYEQDYYDFDEVKDVIKGVLA